MKNSFYYLTVEELNKLNQFDFTDHPDLEISRDIFMLQSETGMRFCDVLALTSANVIGGAIHYVERKTNKVIHVQLTSSAREIVERYICNDKSVLFPSLSVAKYNQTIKEMLRLAGINRVVTVKNHEAGVEESLPIYEVANSQMARCSFVYNLLHNSFSINSPGINNTFINYKIYNHHV